jgi:hypothetical protein
MDFDNLFGTILDFLFFVLPIAIPIFLVKALFEMWVSYAREKFLASQEYKLLRVIPPRDFFKTPMAMELFINALYQTSGESTPIDRFWYGKVRTWFSLELASHEGEVAFYIWTRKNLSNFIQNQIFAQYPGIEIKEVEDYVSKVDYSSGDYSMFGLEYELTQPDPVPIKTYVDYGLDKPETKDELRLDPITPTIEFLGSLKQGEHAWIQIIVRAHKKEDKDETKWFGKTDNWVNEANDLIKEIKEKSVYEDSKGMMMPLITKGQTDRVSAIERSVAKLGFDCGIRSIYIAEKDAFSAVNIPALVGSFKQYGASNLNGFKPRIATSFDYFWEDITGKKLEKIKKEIYEAYKERNYFWRKDHKKKNRKKMVLNSEELATIYHFPGADVQTPTLTRVQSKRGSAPSNLPI